ncbi:MAG: glycosyltransferase family 9 protein [Kastovskya adunca ATA6-11-RM4]|jgi:ADP-heptose:LPS heptosyltransferase|nr:glycosyltransferase family 9 protein [Kastovskya adunca ATA6-11-RM4]
MRILALVPGGIGDQIQFFPTLDDLKRFYPGADINVIVEPRAKGAYRVCKSVDEVITFDFKGRNGLADFGNLLGIMRDRECDVALTLGTSWSTGLLLWMSGIPTRIGYSAGIREGFFTTTVPLKTEQYVGHMYHDLLQGLGINSPCPDLSVSVPKQDIQWADGEQQRPGIAESGYILIYGGASQLAQAKAMDNVYPAAKWQQIIQDIQQKQPDMPIVLLQNPENAELIGQIMSACPSLKVISPPDIGKLAAMIAGANLLLCTDSAPMHLAVAVGTYTIALFGPTEAKKLLPNNDKCFGLQSPSRWIADIKPEDVIEQIWRG